MGLGRQSQTSDGMPVRSLKRLKAKSADVSSPRVQFQAAITRLKNGVHPLDSSDQRQSLDTARPRQNDANAQDKIRADASSSSGGPSLAAVALAAGSGDEPAPCQTPATTGTKGRPDRESVASSTPTPMKKSSRLSAESGGAELRNAVSNWLHGTESLAFGASRQSHPSSAPTGSDRWDERGNRRNLPGKSAR